MARNDRGNSEMAERGKGDSIFESNFDVYYVITDDLALDNRGS